VKKIDRNNYMSDRFDLKARLNLNDLLRRRADENKIDKKLNLIIFSIVATAAAAIVLIVNI
jgi:hypothetical protein